MDAVNKTGITVSFISATRHKWTFLTRFTKQPLGGGWVHFARASKSWIKATCTWHLTWQTSTRRKKSFPMLLIWINRRDFFYLCGESGSENTPKLLVLHYDVGCELLKLWAAFFHMKFTETPTMSESRTEYKLKSPPEDGITNVTFGPNSSQVGTEKIEESQLKILAHFSPSSCLYHLGTRKCDCMTL